MDDDEILRKAQAIKERRERAADRKERAETAKLIGKCYRMRNSYGVGGKKDWYLYRKVVGVTTGGEAKTVEFQTDCYGRFECKRDDYCLGVSYDFGVEIPAAEFNREFRKQLGQAIRAVVGRGR